MFQNNCPKYITKDFIIFSRWKKNLVLLEFIVRNDEACWTAKTLGNPDPTIGHVPTSLRHVSASPDMFEELKAAAIFPKSIIDNNKSGFKSGQIASKIQEKNTMKKYPFNCAYIVCLFAKKKYSEKFNFP